MATKKKSTTKKEKTITVPKKKKKKNYINNKDLMTQIQLSHEQDQMTDELAKMLQTLCFRYGYKARFNVCSSFRDDMISFAIMTIVKVWRSFNHKKFNNPFAYFTQVATYAFYQYQNYERKHRQIRDDLLVSNGYNPSFTYDVEHEFQSALDRYQALNNAPDIEQEEIEEICKEYFSEKDDGD